MMYIHSWFGTSNEIHVQKMDEKFKAVLAGLLQSIISNPKTYEMRCRFFGNHI